MFICSVTVPYGIVAYKYGSNFQLLVSKKKVCNVRRMLLLNRTIIELDRCNLIYDVTIHLGDRL